MQSHKISEECHCKRFNCSEVIPALAKQDIIKYFGICYQNLYLCGLINILPVKNRRPQKNETEANLRDVAVTYKIRFKIDKKTRKKCLSGGIYSTTWHY